MPYPVNEARGHQFPKTQYKVKNWSEYDQALQNRGSLTLWITPEAMAASQALPTGKRGRARHYSDLAIETGYLLRLAFGRPWRQTEGLLRSITTLLGVSLEIPDTSVDPSSPESCGAFAVSGDNARKEPAP